MLMASEISADDVEKDVKVGQGVGFQRIRRITGYLVGVVDRFNNAKRRELNDRVIHMGRGFGKVPRQL